MLMIHRNTVFNPIIIDGDTKSMRLHLLMFWHRSRSTNKLPRAPTESTAQTAAITSENVSKQELVPNFIKF